MRLLPMFFAVIAFVAQPAKGHCEKNAAPDPGGGGEMPPLVLPNNPEPDIDIPIVPVDTPSLPDIMGPVKDPGGGNEGPP